MASLLCKCGFPTHDVYGERCENCFADAMELAGEHTTWPHVKLRVALPTMRPLAMSPVMIEALEARGIDSETGLMRGEKKRKTRGAA